MFTNVGVKRVQVLFVVVGITAVSLIALLTSIKAAEKVTLTRITFSTDLDRDSGSPAINDDGTIIAFISNSDFLNQGLDKNTDHLWLFNTTTMTFTGVTTNQPSTGHSFAPSISADGSKVAFQSSGDLLNEGLGTESQIWLYDTATLTYTRITTSSNHSRHNHTPSISGDGSTIVFRSDSDLLNEGIKVGEQHIWLYSTITKSLTRITPKPGAYDPVVNYNGSQIAFESSTDFLDDGLSIEKQIWLYDTNTMTFVRATASNMVDRQNNDPSISADGSKIVFESDVDYFNEGIENNQDEIWLYDTTTLTLTRLTSSSHTERDSFNPHISDDGLSVTFSSDSDFFNEGIQVGEYQAWQLDLPTMTFTRLTTSTDHYRTSASLSINYDGTIVAIRSDSDLLNEGMPDNVNQIWLASIDSRGPDLITTFPQNSATNVAVDSDLIVTFNEAIQAGDGNITIHLASDDTIVQTIDVENATAVTINDTSMIIDLPNNLDTDTEYYVNIEAGAIEDLVGNLWLGISSNTEWRFRTNNSESLYFNYLPNIMAE